MDKIIVSGLRIYAFHGVNEDEKEKGQPFELDITCSLDLSQPCASDRVEDTVSYAQIIKLVKKVMTERSYDLLERTAQAVIDEIFAAFPKVQKIDLLLKKPRAPILADFEWVGVSLTRERNKFGGKNK